MDRRGAMLLEIILWVWILVGTVFVFHLKVSQWGSKSLKELDTLRVRYDGVILWKP